VFTLYLKSLEIQGFKSFPSLTRLTFDKPITAIVGPNGSGKSNIADAIQWVMGEQSTKTLRGGKMEDVIFGGTQRRSQLGFAEVSLILDNSEGRLALDSTEIMLTRRYYRSGESEYYINQSLVRLRDMTDLLMDTGLGREGYCIIGQGKIADILSTKSKDRREVFEEAAGISRYRHRKDESERKLQQTDDNLLRIGDKISELALQIDPLREQAQVAKEYLMLSGELRGIEISLWLRELESLSVRSEKTETDHVMAARALDAAKIDLDTFYTESESLSELTKDSDIEAESIRGLITASQGQHSDAESSIAVYKSQLESNTSQIENLSFELKSQDDRQNGVGTQISDREARLGEILSERQAGDEQMSLLISELQEITNTSGEAGEALNELIRNEQALQSKHSDKKSGLSALASQAQELYDMENSVKQELSGANEELKDYENNQKKSARELIKAREELTSLENVVNGLKMKAEGRAKKAQASGEKLDSLTLELKTLQSRKNWLTELEKDYEGYSKSVKMVMQEHSRGALSGIHGTVGGLIKTDNNYTVAIETALGGSLQNIIVDSEDDGKAAINYLKRRDGGRATFLPISTVKGDPLGESAFKADDGFEGLALNLVKFNPKYAGIYASLLGRVVIADNLNNAVRIAKKHNHRFKIVTLDGQIMNAGGSMTGGSAAGTVGVLSRANELAQLEGRLSVISNDLNKAQREFNENTREKTAADYELETAITELRAAQEEIIKLELEETHRKQLLQSSTDAINAFREELDSIAQRIENNLVETKRLKDEITNTESDLDAIKDKIEKAVRGNQLLAEERELVNTKLAEIRVGIAALDAERDTLYKDVNELNVLRDEMFGSRERQLETITGLKAKNESILADILEKEQKASKILEEIESHKERLSKLNDRKLEIEAKRNSFSKTIQDKNDELLNLQRDCSRLEQRKQSIEMEEKQIIDKLWDHYKLSKSAAATAGTPIESIKSAQKRINTIKREISELGTPNIGAIDEFERVSTRYEFLTSQRDDVEKAKTELTGIINEITAHMKAIFTREFDIINQSFERTFKELFGGGRASLVLEDPDDVLNCGIEIQVQPPGKSLKTLTLLSGGEKSFVAIAIYFAILSVRPPPFVVMDEIDAALDDANVLRFADYMRFMSNKTQMIIISHKRGTMEEADVLYGITMQELGVSNLLCIDLDEAEKHMRSKVTA
jgi:chromosome segregation protein